MDINTIMVIGAGQMGGGIAQVAAQSGLKVILNDVGQPQLEKGLGVIDKNLARGVEKGRLSAVEKDAILARFTLSTNLEDAARADFIVEAATENMTIKTRIFQSLDAAARPGVILATNTSSLPITEVAAVTGRPELVIGPTCQRRYVRLVSR